jgi:cellulose synthase/poly-beta-1,6-N-acetylglucosamine synthase-like glycosyltransferase
VLAQDFDDLELIMVDDGSTDGSTAIAREYAGAIPAGASTSIIPTTPTAA